MLTEAKAKSHLIPISANVYSEDPASLWRIWYTFLVQQGGSFIKDGKLSFDDPLNLTREPSRSSWWLTGHSKG
jgi:hypothetical protein